MKDTPTNAPDQHLTGDGVLLPDCKHQSYWMDGLAVPPRDDANPPARVDVAIIGSGYTGLNAAIETARGGRSTVVLEAETPGWGCSTRNGGQISTSVKPSQDSLATRFGAARAQAIRAEGETALEWIGAFIAENGIDCDFRRCGRFHAAHSPSAFKTLASDAEALSRSEGIPTHVVPRAEQRGELGSDAYHGGVVFPRHAALDPGRYHRGLLQLARDAGALVVGQCRVTAIGREGDGFHLQTAKGPVQARDVIVATNGYTTGITPWLQRRVIPIGSYIIATEPLPAALMDELFPTDRIASDTCKVVYYYRPSPDRTRVLFGGRVSARETDTAVSAPKLHADMCRIFPQLAGYGVSHSWMGFVAYTFDELAHTGMHDGIRYAMGYCGSGVSMASYLGMRLGQKTLGLKEGQTALDDLPNPTRPFYRGNPWFLPATVAWYRRRDQIEYRRAARETA